MLRRKALEVFVALLLPLLAGLPGCRRPPEPYCCTCIGYEKDVRAWRVKRLDRLKAKEGWLRLAGLFWLKPGENRIGSGPDCQIVLPARAPAYVGIIGLTGSKVSLKVAKGVEVTHAGKPVEQMLLESDVNGRREPDKVKLGNFTFFVIERGDRLALRLFDTRAKALLEFHGLDYFPIDQRFRVTGRFVPYQKPRTLAVTTVIQTTEEASVPGEVIFDLEGREYKLLPMAEPGDKQFFFVFADKTNGHETYGGGRFLVADRPAPGSNLVHLDFNKAYNPPCAFTHFATCPIPRRENRLPLKIAAGEKRYRKEPHRPVDR